MTITQAEKYLKQAYRLNELINSNKEEIAELRLLSTGIGAIDYSKDSGKNIQVCGDANFTNTVAKIIELENLINVDIERMVNLKIEIRTMINMVLDKDAKLLLKYRYLNFLTWEKICENMSISMRTAYRIHTTGLKNIVLLSQTNELHFENNKS